VFSARFLVQDGRLALVTTNHFTARIWSVGEGRLDLQRILAGHEGAVIDADASPLGDLYATASQDGTAALWSARGDAPATFLRSSSWARVTTVRFSTDGRWLLSGSQDGGLRVWDCRGHVVADLHGHAASVNQAEWHAMPDGASCILTASEDGTARLWHLFDPELPALLGHENRLTAGFFVPPRHWSGACLATLSFDRSLRLWDARGKETLPVPATTARGAAGPGRRLFRAARSEAGDRIAVAADAEVYVARCREDRIVWGRPYGGGTNTNVAGALALSASGERLVTSPMVVGQPCRLFSVGAQGRGETLPWDMVNALAFSPTRADELAVVKGGRIDVACVAAGAPTVVQASHEDRDRDYASTTWSPDGEQLAIGTRDGVVELWDRLLQSSLLLPGHDGAVVSIAFSADGQLLLTGSQDRTAKLWTRAGRELATYRGHAGTVTSVAISPDGRLALTTSEDGIARLWHVSAQALIEHVDRRLKGRTYTDDQRGRYAALLPAGVR
jgi:WD40 repeat protein